jgi:hypothetical protein
MRTTIHSRGVRVLQWWRLCWLKCLADNECEWLTNAGFVDAVVLLEVCVECVHSLCSEKAYLEGDGTTSRVEMNSLPPAGVNLQALLSAGTEKVSYIYTVNIICNYLARFVTICRNRVSSPRTIPSPSGCCSICRAIDAEVSPIAWYAARLATCGIHQPSDKLRIKCA